jgi:hypothetical protein
VERPSTKDISNELKEREGVTYISIDPYDEVKIITGHKEKVFTGPAIIIINQD